MLKIEDLEVSYGAVQALRGISMEVNDGEIVSLIGANGAGKTTTLHAITGLVPIKSGSVIYDGHDLRKTDPSRIVTMGLAHVPEGRQVFTRMTVAENLAMGAYFRKDKKAIAEDLERVYARFPRLKERAKQLAGTLSGGEQQMLAMGRAIMSAPKLIVMDEPSMGLSPVLVQEVFSIIQTMHELGITILLVEQNAKMALAIADRAYVLENGRITMSGGAHDLLHDDKVRKAYPAKRTLKGLLPCPNCPICSSRTLSFRQKHPAARHKESPRLRSGHSAGRKAEDVREEPGALRWDESRRA